MVAATDDGFAAFRHAALGGVLLRSDVETGAEWHGFEFAIGDELSSGGGKRSARGFAGG